MNYNGDYRYFLHCMHEVQACTALLAFLPTGTESQFCATLNPKPLTLKPKPLNSLNSLNPKL